MQENEFMDLAKARIDRSLELLNESKELLKNGSYKSANNRAYYSIEKAILALLALAKIQTHTHKGCLLQFNIYYVENDAYDFHTSDYKLAAKAEKIRNASDYDDFYIADKNESSQQVKDAEYLYDKIKNYLNKVEENALM